MPQLKTLTAAARRVETYLAKQRIHLRHTQALEVVARVYGMPNWNTFQASAAKNPGLFQPGSPTGRISSTSPAIQSLPIPGVQACRSCGSPLDPEGYCAGQAECVYQNWLQAIPLSAFEPGVDLDSLAWRYGTIRRMRVSAQVRTDDHAVTAAFDAAPWFKRASAEAILALANIDWGGNYAADDVALYFSSRDERVGQVFDYCAIMKNTAHQVGFECYVDEGEAMAWLKCNAVDVWSRILCERHDVSLVEAQEDESRGRWGWAGPHGHACEPSFSSAGKAAMNAVAVLGLGREDTLAGAQDLAYRIRSAQAWELDGSPLLSSIDDCGQLELTGDPENEVFYLSWEDDGHTFADKITEDDLCHATLDGNKVLLPGEDGVRALVLYDLVPAAAPAPTRAALLKRAKWSCCPPPKAMVPMTCSCSRRKA